MMTKIKRWSCNNKILVILLMTTFCLFVSTVAISAQKKVQCEQKLIDKLPNAGDQIAASSSKIAQSEDYYRLSRNVVPKNYELLLTPFTSNKSFDGAVTITLRVLEPTQTISLHSNGLTIHEVLLEDINNHSVVVTSTNTTSDTREFLNIYLGREISQQYYKLHLKFSGSLDKKIVGLYASNLKNGG